MGDWLPVLYILLAYFGVAAGLLWANWDVLSPYGPEQRRVGRGDD